jgi:thiamine biosynthesis lipoprotein
VSLHSCSFQALGTTATLCVGNEHALDRAHALLKRELVEIDDACSRFRADSELARLNAAAGRAVPVSPRLWEAIEVAVHAAAASEGLVDPTVGRTLRLAGYDQTFALVRLRDGSGFRARFEAVPGWRRLELDADTRTVRLPHGCELDLGATAKALAADRAAHAAAVAVGGGVLVALGGDVAVAGEPPSGGWTIRLADDHTAALDGPGPVVSICSGGLASSGTFVRRWLAGRVALHHIIDPRSGRPAQTPWRTVSVAAGSCVDANTASTAAVVLGDAAVEWLSQRRLPARLVPNTGPAFCVAGWPEEGPRSPQEWAA